MTGIIIKCLGGLYTVESPDGLYECKARGVFRERKITLYTGDYCEFSDGVITEILDRKNCIIRPPLANLDRLIFVVSSCNPSPNLLLLDKFIAIAEYKNIVPAVVLTKTDLADVSEIEDIYRRVGIDVYTIDYSNPSTIDNLKNMMNGKISAFTGNSGAGKSTLLNAIDPKLNIPTAEISRKLGRGRHTTRHAELYKLDGGGYIADTPGFSTFETNKYDIIRKEQLADCFIEFREHIGKCRFNDCSHTCEKGCAVIDAVKSGEIPESRHASYCAMYEEAKQIKEWELK
jgi:ribosome biogenesis GTPase